jgi:hypothetical protein
MTAEAFDVLVADICAVKARWRSRDDLRDE